MEQEKDSQFENGTVHSTSPNGVGDSFLFFKPHELDAKALHFDKNASSCTNVSTIKSDEQQTTRSTDKADVDAEEGPQSEDLTQSCVQTLLSWRAVVYFLFHVSILTLTLPRTSVNMAFVCVKTKRAEAARMANESKLLADSLGISGHANVSLSAHNGSRKLPDDYDYIMNDINWDSETQGLILSGQFMLACLGPMLFDGLRQRVGGRLTVTVTLVCNTAFMVTSPVLARASPYLLLVNQILLGLMSNGIVPVLGSVLPQWTPENQRLTASAVVFAGFNVGSILSFLINGFLCSVNIDNGWPFIFYISGMILTVFTVAWFFLMADSPEKHPFISEKEKIFIQSTRSKSLNQTYMKKSKQPPYLVIIKSAPVMAYIIAFSCFMWTLGVAFALVPIYLNSVHGFNAQETGMVFALACCVRVAGSFCWTLVGNFLSNRGFLSQPATRKTCICTGFAVASVNALAVSFFDGDNSLAAITFIVVMMFFQAVSTSHLTTIPMEIAPRFAGTVMSLGMSVALLLSLSGPLAVAKLTPTDSYSEWRVVWYILSAVFLTASLVFFIFGQAKIQPWAAIKAEHVEPIRDLEQHASEMSMVHVLDIGDSDNPKGRINSHKACNGHMTQSSEFGNLQANGDPVTGNENTLACFQLNTPNNPSQTRLRSKSEKDNPAFIEDSVQPRQENLPFQDSPTLTKFMNQELITRNNISGENGKTNKALPQLKSQLRSTSETTENFNHEVSSKNLSDAIDVPVVKDNRQIGPTKPEFLDQATLYTAVTTPRERNKPVVLESTKL